MQIHVKQADPLAPRQAARGRLLQKRSPRLAMQRLALERAERRLYEVMKDDPHPPAELVSPFVEDIRRLRLEEQLLRDRLARPARRRGYRA